MITTTEFYSIGYVHATAVFASRQVCSKRHELTALEIQYDTYAAGMAFAKKIGLSVTEKS